jgi:hypothetical protein
MRFSAQSSPSGYLGYRCVKGAPKHVTHTRHSPQLALLLNCPPFSHRSCSLRFCHPRVGGHRDDVAPFFTSGPPRFAFTRDGRISGHLIGVLVPLHHIHHCQLVGRTRPARCSTARTQSGSPSGLCRPPRTPRRGAQRAPGGPARTPRQRIGCSPKYPSRARTFERERPAAVRIVDYHSRPRIGIESHAIPLRLVGPC